MSLITLAKRAAGTITLAAKTHAPALLVAGGIATGIACVITACKATTKVSAIIEDAETEMIEADNALEHPETLKKGETYTPEEHEKDIRIIRRNMVFRLIKNYAIPVALGVASIVCTLCGYKILHKRNAALAAAFNGLSAAFGKYRERVREECGDDADRHFRYGTKIRRIVSKDPDTGEETVQFKEDFDRPEFTFGDPQHYDFNAETSTEFHESFNRRPQNWQRLKDTYEWAEIQIATKGHLFLNDVLEMLGLPQCAAGQILGWRRRFSNDEEERFRCPRISFGLETLEADLNGYDLAHMDSYPLIFNCIDIAHNPKMWELDRPYASLCNPYAKRRVY